MSLRNFCFMVTWADENNVVLVRLKPIDGSFNDGIEVIPFLVFWTHHLFVAARVVFSSHHIEDISKDEDRCVSCNSLVQVGLKLLSQAVGTVPVQV